MKKKKKCEDDNRDRNDDDNNNGDDDEKGGGGWERTSDYDDRRWQPRGPHRNDRGAGEWQTGRG